MARSVAAVMYEAHAAANPDAADLPWDLLEPEKQAPWIAAANAAEAAFVAGKLPTTPDLGSDAAELGRALAVYFDATANAVRRIVPDDRSHPAMQSLARLAEAGFWAACALGVG